MSWLFSRALVAEYLGASCSGGEPSALLSVMDTPHKFWHSGKTMDALSLSRFGLTCAVLTESLGAELLTLFLAAFRAKTSAAPVREKDSTANALDSCAKWPGSLARFDRDSFSWRTRQCSLFEDSGSCLETWPRWGLMLDGECLERTTLAPRKKESAFGLWPTPRANDGEKRGNFDTTNPRNGLPAAVKRYMTPTAQIGTKCGGRHNGRADTLASQIAELEGLAVSSTGRLNPLWVEWLMGWPTWWTDCAASETDRFQEWQRQHGCF